MKTSIHIDKKIFKHYNIRSTDVQLEFLLKFNHNQSFYQIHELDFRVLYAKHLEKNFSSPPSHSLFSLPFALEEHSLCKEEK